MPYNPPRLISASERSYAMGRKDFGRIRGSLTFSFNAACSVFALTLFLFVQTLAASHWLHEHFHEDAETSAHQCAATLLSQGQVNCSEGQSIPVRSDVVYAEFKTPAPVLLLPIHYKLLPNRGPPV
ncbi:MAG: hypothetical protein H0X66_07335 [Verrucomicrobia bacterium]|nr:hypothetical protein [Verrucomicrobiota bacterium]